MLVNVVTRGWFLNPNILSLHISAHVNLFAHLRNSRHAIVHTTVYTE